MSFFSFLLCRIDIYIYLILEVGKVYNSIYINKKII